MKTKRKVVDEHLSSGTAQAVLVQTSNVSEMTPASITPSKEDITKEHGSQTGLNIAYNISHSHYTVHAKG